MRSVTQRLQDVQQLSFGVHAIRVCDKAFPGGLIYVRLTRWLNATFILLLSFYSAGFAFGFIEPSPRNVLQIALFIVCYLAFLAYPFFEEKWSERKQIGKTMRQQSRQDAPDSPAVAEPPLSRESESPNPPETILNRVEDPPGVADSSAELPTIPLASALAANPQAPIKPNPPIARADQPVTISAPTEPIQPRRVVDQRLVKERIRIILKKLDQVSTFPALIPDIEALFELLPEADRIDLSKRVRTLAEHLFIARRFALRGLSEEEFCELTIPGTSEDKQTYTAAVAVATLQDAKRELRWLQDYLRGADAHHQGQ